MEKSYIIKEYKWERGDAISNNIYANVFTINDNFYRKNFMLLSYKLIILKCYSRVFTTKNTVVDRNMEIVAK